jgi:hypothetical protein
MDQVAFEKILNKVFNEAEFTYVEYDDELEGHGFHHLILMSVTKPLVQNAYYKRFKYGGKLIEIRALVDVKNSTVPNRTTKLAEFVFKFNDQYVITMSMTQDYKWIGAGSVTPLRYNLGGGEMITYMVPSGIVLSDDRVLDELTEAVLYLTT